MIFRSLALDLKARVCQLLIGATERFSGAPGTSDGSKTSELQIACDRATRILSCWGVLPGDERYSEVRKEILLPAPDRESRHQRSAIGVLVGHIIAGLESSTPNLKHPSNVATDFDPFALSSLAVNEDNTSDRKFEQSPWLTLLWAGLPPSAAFARAPGFRQLAPAAVHLMCSPELLGRYYFEDLHEACHRLSAESMIVRALLEVTVACGLNSAPEEIAIKVAEEKKCLHKHTKGPKAGRAGDQVGPMVSRLRKRSSSVEILPNEKLQPIFVAFRRICRWHGIKDITRLLRAD